MTPVPSIGDAFVLRQLLGNDPVNVQANHWIDQC
jgi:hypothetical protein